MHKNGRQMLIAEVAIKVQIRMKLKLYQSTLTTPMCCRFYRKIRNGAYKKFFTYLDQIILAVERVTR